MADHQEVPGKQHYKRVSIATAGNTLTVTMTAVNLSEALNQEIDYYYGRGQALAQVNIEHERNQA